MSKYAQLSQEEIQFIMSKQIGRTDWAVYCCLAAHCYYPKFYCNPTIPYITEWLGNNVKQNAVEKALKKLEDKGLLVRNSPTSLKRFILVWKKNNSGNKVIVDEVNNKNFQHGRCDYVQPSNMEGTTLSNMEGTTPSNMEVETPSNMEGIILHTNITNPNISLLNKRDSDSNESLFQNVQENIKKDLSEEDLILFTKIRDDENFEIRMILKDYENYSRLTGYVFTDSQRTILKNQSKIKGSHKYDQMRISIRNWKRNPLMPFRKR